MKDWLEMVYREHGVTAALAAVAVGLIIVVSMVAQIDVAAAWQLLMGWVQ